MALREKRLQSLLQGRSPGDPPLSEALEDAELLGSLELAGFSFTWEEVQASRRDAAPDPIHRLRRARGAVAESAGFGREALLTWHREATGDATGFRRRDRGRGEGPPPAPAHFIAGRLEILEQWLGAESTLELKPPQQAALALARLIEILPFEDGNGRVSRLAASHIMLRAGGRPVILVGADGPRLVQALHAAFQLATEPLAILLQEASDRSVDVMIQTLEGRG
jgi:fido (protein-threonine AMPylation protein)